MVDILAVLSVGSKSCDGVGMMSCDEVGVLFHIRFGYI